MICPVCGYGYLDEDAMNHDVCPSCGTEFGYDDIGMSHEELRKEWLSSGGKWFDRSISPPSHWDPWNQVIAAFYRPHIRSLRQYARVPAPEGGQRGPARLIAA
jgi:hypothetical protein